MTSISEHPGSLPEVAVLPTMRDPYIFGKRCVERLLNEYRLHRSLIVAVDFDDTVFDFHEEGNEYDRVLELLRRCKALNFHIVLFTASDPSNYPMQLQYMADKGIPITCINKNPIPLPFGHNGKIYYNILLDDRAGLGQAYATLKCVVDEVERTMPCVHEFIAEDPGPWSDDIIYIICRKCGFQKL